MTAETAGSAAPIRVALCMSGGGYRAAGFHLGTLRYLQRVGLGERIERISTVSGGTFVGAAYALSLARGRSFDEFQREFHDFLLGTDLVSLGLRALAGPPPDTPSGRHDLIVAMAGVYAETFFHSPDGAPVLFGEILDASMRLTDVVFNATEFRHGIAFRFQRSARSAAPIGNGLVSIPREEARQIRLADIVAASSCFPGGFEPLAFPFDFRWSPGGLPEALRRAFSTANGDPNPIALMDGGVYDNQGIDSLLLAGGKAPEDVSHFIISDVDEKSDDLYPYPAAARPTAKGPTLGRVAKWAYAVIALCLASFVAEAARLGRALAAGKFGLETILALVPMALAAVVAAGLWWVRDVIRHDVLPAVPKAGYRSWDEIRRLRLRQVLDMVSLRGSSLLALASQVFMKRIRGLVYEGVYGNQAYTGSRMSNLIYHLASGSRWPAELPSDVPRASPALQAIADRASTMRTTLWFDSARQLEDLIVTGEATICFNLMKHVVRNHGADPSLYPPAVRALWDGLRADWDLFNRDPKPLAEPAGSDRGR